jgi:hypothetical protein
MRIKASDASGIDQVYFLTSFPRHSKLVGMQPLTLIAAIAINIPMNAHMGASLGVCAR